MTWKDFLFWGWIAVFAIIIVAMIITSTGEDDFDRCEAAGGRWGEVTEVSAEGRWFTYEGCSVEVP